MKEYQQSLHVTYKGSVDSHPAIPLVPSDVTLRTIRGAGSEMDIIARQKTTHTDLAGQVIHSRANLKQFAIKAGFPSRALILRRSKTDDRHIFKDIRSWDNLFVVYSVLRAKFGQAYVEVDMRTLQETTEIQLNTAVAGIGIENLHADGRGHMMPKLSTSEDPSDFTSNPRERSIRQNGPNVTSAATISLPNCTDQLAGKV